MDGKGGDLGEGGANCLGSRNCWRRGERGLGYVISGICIVFLPDSVPNISCFVCRRGRELFACLFNSRIVNVTEHDEHFGV